MQAFIEESLAKQVPRGNVVRPFSSSQPDPKVRKQTAGDVPTPGKARRQAAEWSGRTPQSGARTPATPGISRPPREKEVARDALEEPDLVQMAKSMLKVIPVEDRKSVKGVGTLNLEAILVLLAESMLRVYGLRKPISYNKEASATLQVKKDLEAARKKILELE
ncbi:uncharacterized protein LOC110694931 [Chenopodium quinoa]|uniref:uncharacterized protein LOC110694931 n=1 Tax=Chenopodium quinoa TaxID=63459 RepID=UPI000B77DA8F|nr:uncharacterized protein LOC110694931 [Chenopodium quinoa]XP_021727820.1 uncharacterized protein LOC110694931 [Chenopodium quinoa]